MLLKCILLVTNVTAVAGCVEASAHEWYPNPHFLQAETPESAMILLFALLPLHRFIRRPGDSDRQGRLTSVILSSPPLLPLGQSSIFSHWVACRSQQSPCFSLRSVLQSRLCNSQLGAQSRPSPVRPCTAQPQPTSSLSPPPAQPCFSRMGRLAFLRHSKLSPPEHLHPICSSCEASRSPEGLSPSH